MSTVQTESDNLVASQGWSPWEISAMGADTTIIPRTGRAICAATAHDEPLYRLGLLLQVHEAIKAPDELSRIEAGESYSRILLARATTITVQDDAGLLTGEDVEAIDRVVAMRTGANPQGDALAALADLGEDELMRVRDLEVDGFSPMVSLGHAMTWFAGRDWAWPGYGEYDGKAGAQRWHDDLITYGDNLVGGKNLATTMTWLSRWAGALWD